MLTAEEKQGLAGRCRESFKQAVEANRQAEDADRKSVDALQGMAKQMSVYEEETGRKNLSIDEIVAHLESQGRHSQLAEFLDVTLAVADTDQEADTANTEADIANARADTFLADAINQGILDRDDEGVAAALKNLRKNENFLRENEKRAVRLTPGSEQPLRDLRQKLKERGM